MKIISSFLSLGKCLDIMHDVDNTLLKEPVWKINKTNWQSHLTRGYTGSVYLVDFRDHYAELDKKITWQIQDSGHFKNKIDWKSTRLILQVWDTGSGCNWHTDNHCDFACTIYLNDIWKEEWGGILRYRQNDEDKYLIPETGTMVINHNQAYHMVTESKAPHFRYTLQCFGKYL